MHLMHIRYCRFLKLHFLDSTISDPCSWLAVMIGRYSKFFNFNFEFFSVVHNFPSFRCARGGMMGDDGRSPEQVRHQTQKANKVRSLFRIFDFFNLCGMLQHVWGAVFEFRWDREAGPLAVLVLKARCSCTYGWNPRSRAVWVSSGFLVPQLWRHLDLHAKNKLTCKASPAKKPSCVCASPTLTLFTLSSCCSANSCRTTWRKMSRRCADL